MDFWEKIKDELEYRGITQKDLAIQLDINIQTLRNSMSLKRLPDLESAYKIAQFLNQPLEYLLNGDVFAPNNYHLPTREIKLLENYRNLTDKEKNAIDNLVATLSADKIKENEPTEIF